MSPHTVSSLRITSVFVDGRYTVTAVGELNAANAPLLRDFLVEADEFESGHEVVIDLSGCVEPTS